MKKNVITVVALLVFSATGTFAQSVNNDNSREIERMLRNVRVSETVQTGATPIIHDIETYKDKSMPKIDPRGGRY